MREREREGRKKERETKRGETACACTLGILDIPFDGRFKANLLPAHAAYITTPLAPPGII